VVMTEKPLHVRVAEALGWTDLSTNGLLTYPWYGIPWPNTIRRSVPYYDSDWSATGPLIEKYGICVSPDGRSSTWGASGDGSWKQGEKPLIAICNLILALAAAGKLKAWS